MRILLVAGGTGGHINPALAVAGKLKDKLGEEADILFIGTPDHMETELVPTAGYKFKGIEVHGFSRGKSVRAFKNNVVAIGKILSSSRKARQIIRKFDPDVAIGFGGYVSGPVIMEACLMHVPSAIHEQNAFPGVANRVLARFVDLVLLTSEDAVPRIKCKNKPVITGLPVRQELIDADRKVCRSEMGIKDSELLILSMGGSLGAEPINRAVASLIAAKKADSRIKFLHGTGGGMVPKMKKYMKENGLNPENMERVEIREYISDMDRCMAAADIVIGRAGASSLYEIRATGKASILIPSPYVTENHQYFNALELADRGAAFLIEEKDLNGATLLEKTDELIYDDKKRHEFERKAKQMAITDSADRIASCLCDISRKPEERRRKTWTAGKEKNRQKRRKQ